jgi:hypothetical protein
MKIKVLFLTAVIILVSSAATMAQVPSYVPTNGLVGWWPFNGNANDESGNGNNGTVNGATLTTDRFGNSNKAYSFNGSKIITPYQGIAGKGSRTISFWYNTDSLLNSNGINDQWCLVGYGGGGAVLPCGTFFNCNLKSQSSNDLGMDGGASLYFFNTNSIPSSWHNFVVTYDSLFGINMQSTKVYIDGVFQSTPNYTLGTSCSLNTFLSYPLTFGANPNPNNTINNYVGKLDDIGFWNRALSSQEITDLYNSRTSGGFTACELFGSDSLALVNSKYYVGPADNFSCTVGTNTKWVNTLNVDSIYFKTIQHRFFDYTRIYNSQNQLIWSWNGESVPTITWYGRYHGLRIAGNDSIRLEAYTGFQNFCFTKLQILKMFCEGYISDTCTADIQQKDTTICSGQSITLNAQNTGSGFQSCSTNTLPTNLKNGLVAYYPFCGNANDASGNGNNGTVNGATLTTDRFGNANAAYRFDGLNDIININNTIGNFGTSDFSISTWVLDTSSSNGGTLVGKRNNDVNFLNMTWLNSPAIEISGGTSTLLSQVTTGVFLNNWYNYTLIRSGTKLNVYLNGQLLESYSPSAIANINNSAILSFGGRYFINTATEFFSGKLDDVSIYNRALTLQEVQQLYALQSTEYLWSTGATTPTITVSPPQTTTYKLTVNQNGVTCTDSVKVTVSTPTASITGTNTICSGQSTTLTASGGGTYLWSTGATTASITVNPTQTTTYTVTVTNAAGCIATTSRTVAVNANPTASVSGTNSICSGQSTTLTATGGGTYLWSTGATTASITVNPTQSTAYTVTVTNTAGCTATASRTVTVNANPTASVSGTNSICSGQSTTLTASGGGTYLWSTGATTASITVNPTQSTTYSVTVTNAAGCTATASRTVTVTPTPAAPSVSSNSPVTQGGTISLTAASVSGATYQWTGPNGFTSISRTPSIPNATVTNSGIYSVTITVNGCTSAPASLNVTVNPVVQTITLYLDTTSGISGSEVVAKVRVRNFNKILSAQGTVNFNATQLQFLNTEQYGIPTLAPGNFGTGQTASGRLTFSWNDASLNGVTLSDGSAVFGIRFRILAPGGTSSVLSFGNTPTLIEVVDTSFSPVNTALIQGVVNVLNEVDVAGRLRTESGSGVRSATVAATGSPNKSLVTDTTGRYSFRLVAGSSYEITPSKSNDTLKANGITGLDIVLIQRHILGTLLLGSPYKIIAADVNNSGTVTTADINLMQALILGNNSSFPNGRLWAFVPSSHSFANPQNPFPFPQSRVYASVNAQSNQDFIGMRLGDVNNTYNSSVARFASDTVTLVLPEKSIPANGEASVSVTAKDFNKVAAMQLTISWDPEVAELITAGAPGALGASFGLSRKEEGLLSVLWTEPNAQSITLADDTELFTLNFRAKAPAGSNTELNISSDMTPIEVVDSSLNIMGVKVIAGSLKVENATAIESVVKDITDIVLAPNPFNQYSILRFSMKSQRDCLIRITDISGKQIDQRLIKAAVGQNTLEVGHDLIPGTYLLSIETDDEIQTLKMVVVQ